MEQTGSFEFNQCVSITKSSGEKAGNLHEFRDLLEAVSDESIVHHTYRYFLWAPIFEYTNGFAHWVAQNLGDRILAERLSSIDPYEFSSVSGLRRELIAAVDDRIGTPPAPRDAIPGEEFYFSEDIILIFPAEIRARNLAEFLMGIRYVDKSSIYYHFYEARIRLRDEIGGEAVDDFSKWFLALGHTDLVEKIKGVDPFMHTLDGIRAHIIQAVEDEVRRDMEGLIT